MDKIIVNGNQLKQRQLIIGVLTAAACGAGVYLFHLPFHHWLHEIAGMSDRISDTAGSIAVILTSVLLNNMISLVIFKDISLGVRMPTPQPARNSPEN